MLPGGVSRGAVFRLPYPIYMEYGEGKYLYDLDGNQYVDFSLNYGPNLLGHNPAPVVDRVQAELRRGFGLGGPTTLEAEVSELALAMIPSADQIRYLNTGTEAVMHMVRAARAVTGRDRIVKFEGAYHGSADTVMVSIVPPAIGPQPGYTSVPASEGIPRSVTEDTLAVPYNNLRMLADCLAEYEGQVAGVLIDPSMNRCGLPQPRDGFLEEVARLTRAQGALLMFDEVASGFRYGPGGAQEYWGVYPDLTAYGKCLGGGAAIGAVAGAAEFMAVFDIDCTTGKCRAPQAGTFAANPVTMAATLGFLEHARQNPDLYDHVSRLGEMARTGVNALANKLGVPLLAEGACSMFQVHFGIEELRDYSDFARRDVRFRQHLYWYSALNGLYVPPSGTFFFSTAHGDEDVEAFLSVLESFLDDHYLGLLSSQG